MHFSGLKKFIKFIRNMIILNYIHGQFHDLAEVLRAYFVRRRFRAYFHGSFMLLYSNFSAFWYIWYIVSNIIFFLYSGLFTGMDIPIHTVGKKEYCTLGVAWADRRHTAEYRTLGAAPSDGRTGFWRVWQISKTTAMVFVRRCCLLKIFVFWFLSM